MTHPPQPILEAKPLADASPWIWGYIGPLYRWISMHPTSRPDNYSSPAYNEWEDDQ